MPRSGIYKTEVVRARQRLIAQGRYPSIDAVRAELGNTGSKSTIHQFLREIDEEQSDKPVSKIVVSEALQDLVARLSARLEEEARSALEDARAECTARIEALEDSLAASRAESEALRERLSGSEAALSHHQAVAQQTAEELHRKLLECHELIQERKDLRERLALEAESRASLETKHDQTRESLDALRLSVSEREAQERRAHDEQVQLLRRELSAAQEIARARQTEAVQSRLEATHLAGELDRAQGDLEKAREGLRGVESLRLELSEANLRATSLDQRLSQAMEAVRQADLRCAQLEGSLEEANARAQHLEVSLARTQASSDIQSRVLDELLARLGTDPAAPVPSRQAEPEPARKMTRRGSKRSQDGQP